MSSPQVPARRVLVTGGDGFLGRSVVAGLAARAGLHVVALDVREVPAERRLPGVVYASQDVRDPQMADTLARHGIDTVVHLASIVTPGRGSTRAFEHSVDVGGTANVLAACVALTAAAGPAMRYTQQAAEALHAPADYINEVLRNR